MQTGLAADTGTRVQLTVARSAKSRSLKLYCAWKRDSFCLSLQMPDLANFYSIRLVIYSAGGDVFVQGRVYFADQPKLTFRILYP